MNLSACSSLSLFPVTGTWYRATELLYATVAINTGHTRTSPSRFSAGESADPPFEILYLGDSPLVAAFEAGFLWGKPLVPGGTLATARSSATVNVNVRLQKVADLTAVSEQALLGTNAQELTGDWSGYQDRAAPTSPVTAPVGKAPSQELGETLFSTPQVEGVRTLSAKLPYHSNLIVFPEKMFVGSRLEFRYDPLGVVQVIEGRLPLPSAGQGRRRKRS